MERMVERVDNSEYHRIQHFISKSNWSAQKVFDKVALDTSTLLSSQSGRIGFIIDESSHLKKGGRS